MFHLIKGLGRGGAETLLAENLRFSNPDRFEYGYGYFLPWKSALVPSLQSRGSEVMCFDSSNALTILLAARRVAGHLRSWRADLLHCHLPISGVVGRLAGRLAGVPVIYTEHNRLERYHPLTRRANLLTWEWQDLVIAVSNEVLESIKASSRHATPVRVILNGVDTERFNPRAYSAAQVKKELGIPDSSRVIGSVAVFRTQKRLQDWLLAARHLLDRYPDLHFMLVGDGPLKEELVGRASDLELGSVLHLPGLQADVRPYLAAMDVFMISSLFEGLPIALLEAMSMKRGIVATRVGGIPEVVRSGENGLIVDACRPERLVEAVESMLQDPSKIERMGEAARDTVERQFGMQRMTSELEEAYTEVLGNGRHVG